MCDKEKCCERPEKLKGKPKDCTPAQIKECHGETKKHTCMKQIKESDEDNHATPTMKDKPSGEGQ